MAEIYTKEEIILKIKAIDKQIEKSMGMASYNSTQYILYVFSNTSNNRNDYRITGLFV